ncbi:hypothetical protein M9H77_04246 [Catharanthus roseus]|uniref:Uncharacterized protein n=1 Tax=Catharanthus roseus TaxID=4058 RepID=A0ACC0CDG0_CATRO|nr:hypothetical protein M9H77_04246 [Catharanthus roseus]
MNKRSQSPLGLKISPITRAQRKKLKLQEDNRMITYIEDVLKSKIEELDGQGKLPKVFTIENWLNVTLVGSWIEALLKKAPTANEGTSDTSRMNINEILRSMQQSIEGLARQFQSVSKDVEEFRKGKSDAAIDQRVADNLGGFHSPHHQRPFDNVSTYGYQGRPQVRGGRRGGLGGRGYHRP